MTQGATTHTRIFRDRREAGRILARLLDGYRGRSDVIVLGLPRGGIPVAWEVAAALDAPMDAFLVRKLGVPGHEEFAMGAIALGGRVVVNDDVVRGLQITPEKLQQVAEREGRELMRREEAYRGGRPPLDVTDKTVILVDDGLATGASMQAAVQALREMRPAEIVVAVPAAPESTWREFTGIADDVVVATMPQPFRAVGQAYWDFDQTTDDEVRELLATETSSTAAVPVEVSPADQLCRVVIDAPDGVPPREVLDELIGDARVVLIGESSHGTHEFYWARAQITKWLIDEKGFCGVAAEADWPDAYRVNRYVRGIGDDADAEQALRGFRRFPTWMWRNTVVRDFAEWLRTHNRDRDRRVQAGFYGLDLYSLHRSMAEVIDHLEKVDPAAASRARQRYSCFDHASAEGDGQAYGFAAAFGAGQSCEEAAVDQLLEIQRNAVEYARRDGLLAEDDAFYVERNAHVVRNAEAYYRQMFGGRVNTWNLRDEHMADTLDALLAHLDRDDTGRSRIVVWAHNSHVGDARATEVSADGQTTLGALARDLFDDQARLIGLTTSTGTVTAASRWGGAAQRKVVRSPLPDSVEELFSEAGAEPFYVAMRRDGRPSAAPLDDIRLARAIGVIYLPDTERQSHYFHVRPADQFDAMIHIDRTRALEPLEPTSEWVEGEVPETYPSGL
ncbi:erythromycin esterase family protein [Mycolicibacterium celeriflavum]|uniref:erythromycin esterase family protein n=1 Tax=Mycolicibacterium celeriflavum TaxID=1249101 RepID=UPI000B3386E1|nr:erythromycin esterase family protein [Mycolicibacterium celeriflavum]